MEFKVFTLNCWGLAVVSRNRSARIQAIAELLATSCYDVVCLQEIWLNCDYELIQQKVEGVLPYSHYFYSGVTGSGVCILSRHPIEGVFFHQWPVNGYMHKIQHGDWFGGKGVGLCKLKVNNFIINVYSAHLHAEYDRNSDEYQAHRVLQSFDTAQFIQMTSGGADFIVLAGDLNTEPGDLSYRLLLNVPDLLDSFNEAGNIQKFSATNESLTNSYTPANLVKQNIPGKRIDYILYHSNSSLDVKLKDYCLPLPKTVPGHDFSYSDHEAVFATFIIQRNETANRKNDILAKKSILQEAIEICDDALKTLITQKWLYWLYTLILFIMLLLAFTSSTPYGFVILSNILKVVFSGFMFYTLIMATAWNIMERHAMTAGKSAMTIAMKKLKTV